MLAKHQVERFMVTTKKVKRSSVKNAEELKLPSVLDIKSAGAFFEEIKSDSKAGTNLVLDAKKLEKITTPAIQILLASSAAVKKKKGSLKVIKFSSEVERVFADIGLESQFNEWK